MTLTAEEQDYWELAVELIEDTETSREVTFGVLVDAPPDSNLPWRGPASGAPTLDPSFTVRVTQLPDQTLGLIGGGGFGMMDGIESLFATTEAVLLVAHPYGHADEADFRKCNVVDQATGRWRIHDRKILQPGVNPIMYAVGLIR